MTRRLTLAILGTVAAALLLAGIGTLVLAQFEAREQTEDELRSQADALAGVLALAGNQIEGRVSIRTSLEAVANALEVQAIDVLVINPDGQLNQQVGSPELPAGIEVHNLRPDLLRQGTTVSGSTGSRVYAAAVINPSIRIPAPGPAVTTTTTDLSSASVEPLVVVLIVREVDRIVAPAFRWFSIAAAVTLAVAALVAFRLSRQLTKPLAQATSATRRIAAGDLQTRLEVKPGRHDELAELAESINSMTEALERSRGLERQFLLSVSHDLRTPLTSIRGYAEAISDGTSPDQQRAAAVILAESRRLERLVADLLELAKLESRRFLLDVRPVDVTEVVIDTAEGFGPEAGRAGVALVLAVTEPVIGRADPERLAQVVANLVENALKYAATEIRVSVAPVGDRVEIVVADDGPGIAEEDRPHVFERLYVASRTPSRKEAGSGLGLAIVHELVSAMDGSVDARGREGGGTSMTVLLRR